MNLQTIKANFNRGRLQLEEIVWMTYTVEQLEKENGAMAEKHMEKDMAIRDLMQANLSLIKEIELYKLQETRLIAQLKMAKQNIRLKQYWDMAKENLEMSKKLQAAEKEIERLQVVDQAYAALKKAL